MKRRNYYKERSDYPYALTCTDKETPNTEKPSPEEVAKKESLHAEPCTTFYAGYKRLKSSSNYARSRGESIPENERTKDQQRVFLRNLFYRIKHQEITVKEKIIKYKRLIETNNSSLYPLYHEKLERSLRRSEDRLRDIKLIKNKYKIV